MKKYIIYISLIVLVLIFMSGCEKKAEYEFLQPNENIVKIEYVTDWYNNETILINELSKDKTEKFLIDFKNIDCYTYFTDPGSIEPGEDAIKITYTNGEFELINRTGQELYKDEKFKYLGLYYFDSEQFQDFINKYFE